MLVGLMLHIKEFFVKKMSIKHIPFNYETCKCDECTRNRERKQIRRDYEDYARRTLGPNWKNILSGMGDQ